MGDSAHRGHVGLARQIQGLDDGGELLRGQCESSEGFWKKGYLAEIQ